MTLKDDAKFKGKLTRCLKNDVRNLVNFHASSQKSENLDFDGLLLSNAYKVLDGKVQKCYVSWHERVMKSLMKHWFLVPKMTWGSCWILMRTVASLKMYTLMYYFCRKYIMFEPKKYTGVMCHNTEEWWKNCTGTDLCFEKWYGEFGELTSVLKNDIKNLVNFHESSRKSENLHFDGLLLSIADKNSTIKSTEELPLIKQNLRKKWHEEFCEF